MTGFLGWENIVMIAEESEKHVLVDVKLFPTEIKERFKTNSTDIGDSRERKETSKMHMRENDMIRMGRVLKEKYKGNGDHYHTESLREREVNEALIICEDPSEKCKAT